MWAFWRAGSLNLQRKWDAQAEKVLSLKSVPVWHFQSSCWPRGSTNPLSPHHLIGLIKIQRSLSVFESRKYVTCSCISRCCVVLIRCSLPGPAASRTSPHAASLPPRFACAVGAYRLNKQTWLGVESEEHRRDHEPPTSPLRHTGIIPFT